MTFDHLEWLKGLLLLQNFSWTNKAHHNEQKLNPGISTFHQVFTFNMLGKQFHFNLACTVSSLSMDTSQPGHILHPGQGTPASLEKKHKFFLLLQKSMPNIC